MGHSKTPKPVKLIVSAFARGDDLLQRAVNHGVILGEQVGEAAVGEVGADGVAAGVKHGQISSWWVLF